MPSLPVIAGAVKISLVFSFGGTITNMISWGIQTSLTDVSAIFTAVDSHINAGMWDNMPADAVATEMHIFKYDGVTPTFIQAVSGAKYTGGQPAGTEALIAPATLVSLRTASRGPWARGRIFLPFTAESASGNGSLLDSVRVPMQTAWDAFRTGMSGGGTPMAVISLSNQPLANPPRVPTARLVTTSTVESHLATQRRRQTRLRRT